VIDRLRQGQGGSLGLRNGAPASIPII
jgi:hypothetical protein